MTDKGSREDNPIAKEKNDIWQPLVDYCIELYEEIKDSDYRKAKIEEIKEARKIYEQKAEPKTFPWPDCSNVVLPLTTITVDNQEPRLVAGLVGREPYVEFEMEGMQEKDPETEIIEDWYNTELKHTVKLNQVAMDIVHTLLCDGTYYAIPKYDIDEVIRRDFQFDDNGNVVLDPEDGSPVTEDVQDASFEGGQIEAIEFTDIYVPDNTTNWEKTPVLRAINPTYAELMRLRNEYGYMNVGPWLLKHKVKGLAEDAQSPSQSTDNVKETGKETIPCLECHISYVYRHPDQQEQDIEDFTEERIIAVIAIESKILIRLALLRDVNFKNEHVVKRLRLFPERSKAYGTGIYGKMKAIQNGASDIFNLVIDIATVCMIPWFLFGDNAGLKGDISLKPGGGVPCDNPKEVVFPKFDIHPQQFVEFINLFVTLWERVGTIGDLQIGRPSETRGSKTTATEVLAVIQEGNVKHNYQSNVFKEEFLSLLRTLYDLYYMHMPFEKIHMHKGQEAKISRLQMRRPMKFRLTGSTEMSNKIIQRKEAEDFYALTGDNPLINHMKRLKDLIEAYKPDENTDEWVDPGMNQLFVIMEENPEIMQVIEKYMQDRTEIEEEIEGARATSQ